MQSHGTKSLAETPRHVRHSFDKIVGSLNAKWDLGLPSIHGSQEAALKQADAEPSLERRCAGRIRYLCFRDCQLDKIISDFEDDIPRICSDWVWKPAQEEGTLVKLPVNKNFMSTRPALPREHRKSLLGRLFELLDEEYKLARDSDVYRRTSFNAEQDAECSVQSGKNSTRTAPRIPQNTIPNAAGRQAVETPLDSTKDEEPKTRRSREAMKRKSSESDKVRS
jgi:hypothetical protein